MLLRYLSILSLCVLPSLAMSVDRDIRPNPRPVYEPVVITASTATIRPQKRREYLPDMRWAHVIGSDVWTRAALVAMETHGKRLTQLTPRDIDRWCPAYRNNTTERRAAFWVGLMSTLAKHESTYRPHVSGDSGKSHGLLQIRVPTADHFGCRADSKADLLRPSENLSCAIRIMSRTVARDNAVAIKEGRWRGVASDWGPFTSDRKRGDMLAWIKRQEYCVPIGSLRPRVRPER